MSRSVSYTRATSYLWCWTVIEVEPHRTAVGVYTPVECSSDLMRRAAISLSFLESDPPPSPIFPLAGLFSRDRTTSSRSRFFLSIPPLILLLLPLFRESSRNFRGRESLAPWPRFQDNCNGFSSEGHRCVVHRGPRSERRERESRKKSGEERKGETKGGEGGGSVDGSLSKGAGERLGHTAKAAARALNRPMAISNRMPWRCRCALIIKRRYNKARIIGHKARLGLKRTVWAVGAHGPVT